MSLQIKLKLSANFLEEEIRSGYEVSPKLKKIWAVELDLLAELLRVCKKHSLNVQVFAGTLLGAVRHRGFIPWDDDLDVAMTRRDYSRLCAVAEREFEHPYFFQTATNDRKYFLPYARLRNSETTGANTNNLSPDYNNGIYIDIHPLDGIPWTWTGRKIHKFLMRASRKCCTTYYNNGNSGCVSRLLAKCIRPVIRLLPFRFLCAMCDWTCGMVRWGRRVGMLTHFEFGEKYWMMKQELLDTIWVPFENLEVPVAREADKVLTRIYGNYMAFPDPSVRGKWHEGAILFDPETSYRESLKGF